MAIGSSGVERFGQRRGGWQTGCLIALGVAAVLIVATIVTISLTWKRMAAAGINVATENLVAQSGLPQDQKDRIVKKVHGFTDDFKAGKITSQQFAELAQTVSDSPLLPLGIAMAANEKYFKTSKLTDEEKAAGLTAIRRFARGVVDEKIKPEEMQTAMTYISTVKGHNSYELKKSVPDEDLRKFIAEVKDRADKAAIPEDAADINVADEVEKVIDKTLATAK